MHYLVLIISCSLCLNFATAQTFDWCDDGYISNSGGGTFTNIDGSGIDLTITGMVSDNCSNDLIFPGINDQNSLGIIHYYNFSFSEPVSLEFLILDINTDNTGLNCFHDFIHISGMPTFLEVNDVTINAGDSITPLSPSGNGSVKVRFDAVVNFTITHGDGVACNPGYLIFSSLIINDNILGVTENLQAKEKMLIGITDLTGRASEDKPNNLLIYSYSDGTTEKVFRVE